MKRNISAILVPACLLLMSFLFSSCLKDSCRRTYQISTPVYTKLNDLRAAVQSSAAATIVNTGKLYIKDNWIFLNEQNKGIHIIDNSNPAHPVKTSFINIPGNLDMAVRGNTLYADLYCDLAAIDITNPKHITVSKFLTNTFPEMSSNYFTTNPDSINVITSYNIKDTVVSCDQNFNYYCNSCPVPLFYSASNSSSSSAASSKSGVAGSTARFAAVNNYMYAVTTSNINVIDIYEPSSPVFVQRKYIGWNIESIFPYNNKLYVGAGSSMTVFDLQNPLDPQQLSWAGHWCSHDPVVADNNYAYVTLHASDFCGSAINDLDIYSLDSSSTQLVKSYQLTGPQGLSKDGNLLFICDDGLKIYDATDVNNMKLLKHITGIETSDVIAVNGIAYLVAKDGLYQYDYSNAQNILLLSKLNN